MTERAESSLLATYQDALAAELRALYGYDLLGPRVATDDRALVQTAIATHTALRDAAVAAITAARATPVGPRPDYPELYPAGTGDAAARAAVRLETGCAAAWRFLYEQAADPATATPAAGIGGTRAAVRRVAQHGLTSAAVRAAQWRRRAGVTPVSVAFPGIG